MPDTLANIQSALAEIVKRLDSPAASTRWLSIQSGAAYADLSPKSIRNLLAAGKLTAYRPVKGKILIDRRELDALIETSTSRPRIGRGIRVLKA